MYGSDHVILGLGERFTSGGLQNGGLRVSFQQGFRKKTARFRRSSKARSSLAHLVGHFAGGGLKVEESSVGICEVLELTLSKCKLAMEIAQSINLGRFARPKSTYP